MLLEAAHVLAAIDAEIIRLTALHRTRYADVIRGVQYARQAVLELIHVAEANVATPRKEAHDARVSVNAD